MCQALTAALQSFGGAMVVISHDRHLLKNTVDEFLLVADGAVQRFDGDLETYRDKVLGRTESIASEPKPAQKSAPVVGTSKPKGSGAGSAGIKARSKADRKRRAQLRTRIATIDKRMTRMGEKLKEVETRLQDPNLYTEAGNDVQPLLREQASVKDAILELEAEWLDLSEELEALDAR